VSTFSLRPLITEVELNQSQPINSVSSLSGSASTPIVQEKDDVELLMTVFGLISSLIDLGLGLGSNRESQSLHPTLRKLLDSLQVIALRHNLELVRDAARELTLLLLKRLCEFSSATLNPNTTLKNDFQSKPSIDTEERDSLLPAFQLLKDCESNLFSDVVSERALGLYDISTFLRRTSCENLVGIVYGNYYSSHILA
jgi:hypothetical protein